MKTCPLGGEKYMELSTHWSSISYKMAYTVGVLSVKA